MSGQEGSGGAGESFLARWARLKARGSDGAAPAADAVKSDAPTGPATEPLAEDAPSLLDLTKLPKLDDLTENSDFAAFLQKGVPETLQRMALRKAWSTDPAIRDFIEVAENQYDWNAVDGVPGFGPLPAGTDIEALLAQATGALVEAEPDPDLQVAASCPPISQTAEEPAVMACEGGEPRQKEAVDISAVTETPRVISDVDRCVALPTSVAVERAKAACGPVRARHGGALPRLPDNTN